MKHLLISWIKWMDDGFSPCTYRVKSPQKPLGKERKPCEVIGRILCLSNLKQTRFLWCVPFSSEFRARNDVTYQLWTFDLYAGRARWIVSIISPYPRITARYAIVCTWKHQNNQSRQPYWIVSTGLSRFFWLSNLKFGLKEAFLVTLRVMNSENQSPEV